MAPYLETYELGSSDEEAEYLLLLDREERTFKIRKQMEKAAHLVAEIQAWLGMQR